MEEDSDNANWSFVSQFNVSLTTEYFVETWTGAKEIRFTLQMTQLYRDTHAEI
jgi:hypothetical protein